MAGLRPGHPRLSCPNAAKTWMAGDRRAEATPSFGRLSPGMTCFTADRNPSTSHEVETSSSPKLPATSGPNLSIVSPWFGQTRMKSGAGHMRKPGHLAPVTLDKVRSANAVHGEAE